MNSIVMTLICAGSICGGTLIGFYLSSILPSHHLSSDSKYSIKMGTGVLATLSALVIGLLLASAKSSFDAMSNECTEAGAKIILLDHVLAHYGPETGPAREDLHKSIAATVELVWPDKSSGISTAEALEAGNGLEKLQDKLSELNPTTDYQRALLTQARQLNSELLQIRWLFIEQIQNSLPTAVFAVLILWLSMLFLSIGLFAPRNPTVITALVLCALSFSMAVFLILEMSRPVEGIIKLSSGPMRTALAHLGK